MSPAASTLVQTFFTLAVVCGLAVVVLWAARRAGVGRQSGPIELVGRLPLEARRSIYLVKVGEVILVIGAGEGGFSKLGEVPAGTVGGERAMAPRGGVSFADLLARVVGGRKDQGGI